MITEGKCVCAVHNGSLFERMFSSQVFKNPSCRYCKDHFAENADISFCDFWDKDEMASEHEGNSCVIVRSQRAQDLLHRMLDDNYIELIRNITEKEIEAGQMHALKAKKGAPQRLLSYRLFMRLIDFVFCHELYRRLGLKTYQCICHEYDKILAKVQIK